MPLQTTTTEMCKSLVHNNPREKVYGRSERYVNEIVVKLGD